MCNFVSGIITKSGKVYFNEELESLSDDSHSKILKVNNIKDNTADPEKKQFARFEYYPNSGHDYFSDYSNWKLHIDESVVPFWLKKRHEKKCIEATQEHLRNIIFKDTEIGELKNGVWLLKNCVVDQFLSGTILQIGGSSTVKEMWGSSTVKGMWGSPTVQRMWGSSTVKWMWGSSTVQGMGDGSTVQRMRDSSTVQEMRGSSTVQMMRGSSTVQGMWDSSTVKGMWDSSIAINRGSHIYIPGKKIEKPKKIKI